MSAAAPPIFEVFAYNLATLTRLAADLSGKNTEATISRKSHPAYLDGYFKTLNVQTIVVERPYVDRDYLEDFAAYYVTCFIDYKRYCARMHFFSSTFDKSAFEALLLGTPGAVTAESLQASYCGFIVVKPLPQTVFGRTCLKTYPKTDRRDFSVARTFHANLFGINLKIAETLPFQEQDNVVAACATSALWSVLHATAKEFQHAQLTPIAITRAATEFLPAETRMIPNRGGLATAMMAEAIRHVGLEPLALNAPTNDDATLKGALYAYLRARIPIVLGVRLCNTTTPPGDDNIVGDHAIAVAGFSLSEQPAPSVTSSGFRHRAARIDKIYAHDDQVGPFARMEFDGKIVTVELDDGKGQLAAHSLSTSWRAADGSTNAIRAVPIILLIPLYHKIRIPFEDIIETVSGFHKFLATAQPLNQVVGADNLEWDIHLTTVNDLKLDLQECKQLSGSPRLKWLTQPMPRFIWRALARKGNDRVFDVFFDATDIHTSDGVHGVLCYDAALAAALALIAGNPKIEVLPELPDGARRILRRLRESLSTQP
jgi:hypothetical protein